MLFHEVSEKELHKHYSDKYGCRDMLQKFLESKIPIAEIDESVLEGSKTRAANYAYNLRIWVNKMVIPVKVIVRGEKVFLQNTKLTKKYKGENNEQDS